MKLRVGRVCWSRGWRRDEVYSFEGLWESFVVSGEASEARGPGERAFDDPSARQEHEASLGHGMLDHFKPDAVLLCGLGAFEPV